MGSDPGRLRRGSRTSTGGLARDLRAVERSGRYPGRLYAADESRGVDRTAGAGGPARLCLGALPGGLRALGK